MPELSPSDAGNDRRDNQAPLPDEQLTLNSLDQEQSDNQESAENSETREITSSRNPFWGKTREALSNASTRASSAGAAFASKAASIGTLGVAKTAELGKQTYVAAGGAVEAAVNYVDGELEERGAKQAIKSTAGAVVGKLDEVTGKRLVELLEKKLQKQDAYNDILATRLAEALDRISALENRVTELSSR